MRHLLLICEEYEKKFSIKFNAAMSTWLYFNKGKQPHACVPQFSIDGNLINCASEYTHLGNIISANLDDICEILSKRNSLCGKINNVLCYFRNRSPVVKLKLLRSYCSDFYGSVLWELAHPSVEDVCITWCKGLKRVWELPTRTHSGLVVPLCGLLPLRFELACRCSRFIVKCLNSSNSIVRLLAGQDGIRCCR